MTCRCVHPALCITCRFSSRQSSVSDMQRWGGMLSALLRVLVTHVREDVLLARVDDLGLATTELHRDRERTVNAQEIIVR